MDLKNEKSWDKWVEINADPCGKVCVDAARRIMEILDAAEEDFDCHEIFCRATKDIDAGHITDFMAGCIVEMVSCHAQGEEFRRKWDKELT